MSSGLHGTAPGEESQIPREVRSIELEDRRRLAFAEYGDPAGVPVIAFHGIPGSRLTFAFADSIARRRRFRLIAPDRPGIGLSTMLPQRVILDWPKDIEQLADRLNLHSFGLIGVSGGGPYALAVASQLAGRVGGTAVVSGMGPVDDPWVLEQATRSQRMRLHLFRDLPGFIPLLVGMAGLGLKRLRDRHLMWLLSRMPEPGRQVLQEKTLAPFIFEPLREAYRQGSSGVGLDLKLMTRPWSFRVEDVKGPVILWHGEEDFDVPVLLGQSVARRLPRCDAHFIPEAGHLWILDHVEEVLMQLALLLGET
ncbi:MAG: alpha/beta hydrolase [Acidobacteriota bacterium]